MSDETFDGLGATITEGYHAIQEATCLEDVYDLLDYLGDEVRHYYPHIACKPHCAACCKGMHQPMITAAEFELVLFYLTELPDVIQDEVVRRARFYVSMYRDALILQHNLVNNPEKYAGQDVGQLYKTLQQSFRESSCPFLVVDRCGLYPVRPAKCRMMGNSLAKVGDDVRFNSCLPEISAMDNYLREKGTRKLTMPLWNVFEQVVALFNPKESITASIPVWLITHIQNDKLVDEVNPNPSVLL
jgi:Fe-S-cluster containining protein